MNIKTTKSEGYTVVNNILGTDNSAPLSSAPGLEYHHPDMIMLGVNGGLLYIYR